jgi:hypothetical protein
LFNTDFLRRLQPWSDGLILDDWPTFLRAGQLAAAESIPIGFTPEIELTEYRVHAGGAHANPERQRRALIEVVEKVIPASHQKEAMARVLTECAIISLAQGLYAQAWQDYVAAITADPNLGTALRGPIQASYGVLRRIGRKMGLAG